MIGLHDLPLADLIAWLENDGRLGSSSSGSGSSQGRTITGQVSSAGAVVAGSGFSVNRVSTGVYDVTFDTAFASTPTIVAQALNGAPVRIPAVFSASASGFSIEMLDTSSGAQDCAFHFIAAITL